MKIDLQHQVHLRPATPALGPPPPKDGAARVDPMGLRAQAAVGLLPLHPPPPRVSRLPDATVQPERERLGGEGRT